MSKIRFSVLKGRHIQAQGNALGWRAVFKFVRAKKSANDLSKIRTKWSIHNFLSDNFPHSVRKGVYFLNTIFSRTVSYSPLLPRAAALGYYIPALQAEKQSVIDLGIESRFIKRREKVDLSDFM